MAVGGGGGAKRSLLAIGSMELNKGLEFGDRPMGKAFRGSGGKIGKLKKRVLKVNKMNLCKNNNIKFDY